MESHETSPVSAANPNSHYHMVDITQKSPTLRKAEARGVIRMNATAFTLLRDRTLPKGDALALAEISGILAAKQTSTLLPLCHPLPIEEINIKCLLQENSHSVEVICQVSTTAKTGVEMESLMGTNGALLCLYDLIKMVDPALSIEGVRLNFKQGGKKGYWSHPEANPKQFSTLPHSHKNNFEMAQRTAAVITASDRVSNHETHDLSTPLAKQWLETFGVKVLELKVVPDEKKELIKELNTLCEKQLSLVVISGGTGMGPRDITLNALHELGAKEMKGIGELLRKEGSQIKKSAYLSNSGGFILNKTLILALPGNPKAITEGLTTLKDLIPHALHILNGGNHG